MHINCVICSDMFTPCADIYTTPCGHIFHYTCLMHWFENSKTCPQCRAKVSTKSLIRLFVNVATSQGADADVTVLQHKLDSAEFNMKLKDQEIKNVAIKNQETQVQNQALRTQVKELELAERRFESIIAAQKEQIKYFKGQVQVGNKLQDEISRLKSEIRNLENVQAAVNGSRQQVEDIIKNENSVDSLALLAATLKKSLVDTDRRKKELQYELKKSQNELSQTKRKMTQLKCEYEDTKRQLESLKMNYDKEVTFLKDKFAQLEAKAKKGVMNNSLNESLRRITSESPVNYNRTPVLSGRKEDTVDLSETLDNTPPCSVASQHLLEEHNLVDDITEASPLAASSLGIFGIQRAKALGNVADHNRNKQPAPSLEPVSLRPHYKVPDVTYDGFGGSSKEDIYPTSLGIKRPKSTKMSSSKFKKLSAEAGRSSRKISEFVNLT